VLPVSGAHLCSPLFPDHEKVYHDASAPSTSTQFFYWFCPFEASRGLFPERQTVCWWHSARRLKVAVEDIMLHLRKMWFHLLQYSL
jgi:hypothetical protein